MNMPSLYEILNNAHDGEGMTALGREFGLTRSRNERAWLLPSSWRGPFRWLVSQAEEFWPIPASAGDREGDLRQAGIGLAVPGKAIRKDSDPLHLAVPLAPKHSARPQVHRAPG